MTALLVTLDGPSGTGKSSVSRALASRLSIPHLDTGAFYRAATLAALRSKVWLADEKSVEKVVRESEYSSEHGRMFLNGEDVTAEIRSETVTENVSQVSAYPSVREILVGIQRQWVHQHNDRAVVEGRDIGSVVFPDADVKLYLDARPEVRARRRALQGGDKVADVLKDQLRRDRHDSTRPVSPLLIPEGAIVVDTSDLSFPEVVNRVTEIVDGRVS